MKYPEDLRELSPGLVFDDHDETKHYWLRDGKVMFRHYPIRGAHAESFRFYLGSFAKDRKNCYVCFSKLTGAHAPTFRALNLTYATDGRSVWALGGKLPDADAESFVVCDDGCVVYPLGKRLLRVPHGYGKDKARVFYYDFNGKPNWVRKATAASFVSLNDAFFGRDDHFAFFGAATIPKANVRHWRTLGRGYSQDDARVFYANRLIPEADRDSFEVVPAGVINLAKDHRNYFDNDRRIDQAEFEQKLQEFSRP